MQIVQLEFLHSNKGRDCMITEYTVGLEDENGKSREKPLYMRER